MSSQVKSMGVNRHRILNPAKKSFAHPQFILLSMIHTFSSMNHTQKSMNHTKKSMNHT